MTLSDLGGVPFSEPRRPPLRTGFAASVAYVRSEVRGSITPRDTPDRQPAAHCPRARAACVEKCRQGRAWRGHAKMTNRAARSPHPPLRHNRDRKDSWRFKSRADDHTPTRTSAVSAIPTSSDGASATSRRRSRGDSFGLVLKCHLDAAPV
jgi:hypothetical protein